jgi:hypothetical protein
MDAKLGAGGCTIPGLNVDRLMVQEIGDDEVKSACIRKKAHYHLPRST